MTQIPFSTTHHTNDPVTNFLITTELNGFIRIEGDEVVLQYRVKTSRQAWGGPEESESGVQESRIPLRAIRRAELKRGWIRTQLVLQAADPGSFASIPGSSGDELVLSIPRKEAAGAAELVSSIDRR